MKFSKFKRAVALVACLACVLSAMPVSVFATESEKPDVKTEVTTGNISLDTENATKDVMTAFDNGIIDSIELVDDRGMPTIISKETLEKDPALIGSLMNNGENQGIIAQIKRDNAEAFDAVKDKPLSGKYQENLDKAIKGAEDGTKTQNTIDSALETYIVAEFEKDGKKVSKEVVDKLGGIFSNGTDITKDFNSEKVAELEGQGYNLAYVVSIDPTVADMMASLGMSDPLAFAELLVDIEKNPGNYDEDMRNISALFNQYSNAKYGLDAEGNPISGSAASETITGISDLLNTPPYGVCFDMSMFYSFGASWREVEDCGGGYTIVDPETGDIILAGVGVGAESVVTKKAQFYLHTDYDYFCQVWMKYYSTIPVPSKEEFMKMITKDMMDREIEKREMYLYVDGSKYTEAQVYMYEAYTYIHDVTFTLTRSDGRSIKKEEVPPITPKEFKYKFMEAKNNDSYGLYTAATIGGPEEELFDNMFIDENHRRRATAYLDAFFRLESFLCNQTGHGDKVSEKDTFLTFKKGTNINGKDSGWKVQGNKMTLTIDFYSSFVALAQATGFSVNDIIRNYMSDYSEPVWQTEPTGIKGTYTTHSDKSGNNQGYDSNTYFGFNGNSARSEVKGILNTSGFVSGNYYSSNTESINRRITSEAYQSASGASIGIGLNLYSGRMERNLAWSSSEGPYLGSVHDFSAFSEYFNGQKINTKMFKLGDDTTISEDKSYGFVPFLLTNRPQLSSAYNVQVDAIEYTLYMPAALTGKTNYGTGCDPQWLYFPHREVPAVTQALSTSAGRIQHWDFRDKVEKKHSGPIYEDFFEKYFYDESFYMFYNDIDGKVCTAKQLEAAFDSLKAKNLREDMLVYYSGYAIRTNNGKGKNFTGPLVNKTTAKYASPYGSTKEDVNRWLGLFDAIAENPEGESAEELRKYGFTLAITNDLDGNPYCYAVFGPALTYDAGGLDSHPHGNCNYHKHSSSCNDEKGNRACGRSENLNHSGHSTCCGSEMDSECKHYYTVEHKCSKGIEPDHLEGCCEYVQPSVTGLEMPTMTFNDTHGNIKTNALLAQKSNGYAQFVATLPADSGMNAVNGGVVSDHHRWAWPTTIEAPPGPGPDPEETTTPTSTTPPVTTPGGNGGGGGSGNGGGDGGGGNPKPWPTPITPPGGLKLYGQEGITIEMFITR